MINPIDFVLVTTRLRQILDGLDERASRNHCDTRHSLHDVRSGSTVCIGSQGVPFLADALPAEAIESAKVRPASKAGDELRGLPDRADGGGSRTAVSVVPVPSSGTVGFLLVSTANPTAGRRDLPRDGLVRANLAVGARQLAALMDEWTVQVVIGVVREHNRRAAASASELLATLPKGTWNAADWLDCDGVMNDPVRIGVEIEVTDGRVELDFERTASQLEGNVNQTHADTRVACFRALTRALSVPAMPGIMEAVRVSTVAGSVLDAGREAPRDQCGFTSHRVIDVVTSALAKLPGIAVGRASAATFAAVSLQSDGDVAMPWRLATILEGGDGAAIDDDGAPLHRFDGPGIEALEAAAPLMFVLSSIRADSGGAGMRRGGVGWIHELEIRDAKASITVVGDRGKYGPPGVGGGRDGVPLRLMWWDSGVACDPPMVSRVDALGLRRGQRLRVETAGGGGYGRPRLRDPLAVSRDVRDGYVTSGGARRDYGVEVDRAGRLDDEGTSKLRGGQVRNM